MYHLTFATAAHLTATAAQLPAKAAILPATVVEEITTITGSVASTVCAPL